MSNHPTNSLAEKLKDLIGNPIDLEVRFIKTSSGTSVELVLLRSLSNPAPITNFLTQVEKLNLIPDSFAKAGEVFCASGADESNEFMITHLLKGATIVNLPNHDPFAVLTHTAVKRLPSEPVNEPAIRGARDGFTEDILDNLSFIRKRLPDPNLKADETVIGRRSQTKVAVVYLNDVANPDLVLEVKQRLAKIDIDGVLEPGILEEFIKDNKLTTLPLSLVSERPDKIVGSILEGRVAILVDNSPEAIIVPITLNDLYQAPDDYYFDYWAGSLIRAVRFIGNILAIGLPGLYIALVGSSPQLLPISLGLTIAGFRIGMPFPFYIEVLLAEIMVELLREAGLRLPRGTNQTLGATIGIIIGFALIQTGYISTPTLIVVGISAIASFSSPNYSIGITWRILKYLLFFCASLLGFYGLVLGSMLILAHISGLSSFGTPYLAPWGPWQTTGILDSVIRAPHWLRLKRPLAAKPKEPNRGNKYPKV